jgi:stage V sporulation protein G
MFSRKGVREVVDQDLRFEVVRLHKLDGEGPTKAFCDISVLGGLVINGLRVVAGKEGLFVSMPREVGKDGKWYNTVTAVKRELKDEIDKVVLEAYGG